jgi:hypothetical protein
MVTITFATTGTENAIAAKNLSPHVFPVTVRSIAIVVALDLKEEAMDMLSTFVRADPWRKTRLHDMKGNLVGMRSYADIPRVLWGSVARELWGYRPVLPWIPYPVLRHLKKRLRPEWRVLEFGSGMSTVWLAEHCQFVHSIETNIDILPITSR